MDDLVSARYRAEELWRKAYAHQMNGDLAEAIQLYRASIEVFPTAEAHTFLGWSLSFLGRYDDAIAECKTAIELDPEFGNPYNDHWRVPDGKESTPAGSAVADQSNASVAL